MKGKRSPEPRNRFSSMTRVEDDIASHGGKRTDGAKVRILAAASELLSVNDFEGCSIRDIAGAADVNSALIYYYFQNKEGLLRALIEDATGKLAGLLDTLLLRPEMTSREKIRLFLLEWLEVVANRGHLKGMILRTMFIKGSVGDLLRERIWANVLRVAAILDDAKEKGELRPGLPESRLLSIQIIQAVIAPVLGFPFTTEMGVASPCERERFVDDTLEMFFHGIEACPGK